MLSHLDPSLTLSSMALREASVAHYETSAILLISKYLDVTVTTAYASAPSSALPASVIPWVPSDLFEASRNLRHL